MAFNGSGVFNRIYSWTQDALNGVKISSGEMDAEDNGFATGLSLCLTKDGQQLPTANLPMAGYVHTGVGNATARTSYAAAGQVQDQGLTYCGASGGSANAITLTPLPAITALTAGQRFQFIASASNTYATTLAISGLAATTVYLNTPAGLLPLAGGEIVAGNLHEAAYNGTYYVLLDKPGRIRLSVNTAFYVTATGSDNNPGTGAAPWLTLQHAINFAQQNVDTNGYNFVINVANGTYGNATAPGPFAGAGQVNIVGTGSTVIGASGANCLTAQAGAVIGISGCLLQTSSSGYGLAAQGGTINVSSGMTYGACASGHNLATDGGRIDFSSAYAISGGSPVHWLAQRHSDIYATGLAVTVSASVSIATFAAAYDLSEIYCPNVTFSGSSVSGAKYASALNSVINTGGSGGSYLPGSTAGSTATGGQYA